MRSTLELDDFTSHGVIKVSNSISNVYVCSMHSKKLLLLTLLMVAVNINMYMYYYGLINICTSLLIFTMLQTYT